MEKIDDFKIELKALLEKYNASIWIDLNRDIHGVSADIIVHLDNKEIMRCSDICAVRIYRITT
jgi:hypothetical protein